jgi:transcriptional regulator with XRE-family HTH domain/tetratricopeptide (TPR) repeat protein
MTDAAGEMRRLMADRGLSLRGLARQAGYDPSYLSKVLRGRKPFTPSVAARLDSVLDADGAVIDLAARTTAPRRRAVCAMPIPPVPVIDPSAKARLGHLTGPQTVDLLHHLTDQWHGLVRTDNLLGPRHALRGLVYQLAIVHTLLRTAREPTRQPTLRLGAQYAESAAWLYEDAGDMAASRHWTGQAMEWAVEADDQPMVAWSLFRRSQQVHSEGDAAQVIGLAQAARRSHDVPGPMMAAILQQEACGHALDGAETTCHRLLDQAQELAVLDDFGDARAGHGSFCSTAYIEMQRGGCWFTLGRPDKALAALKASLRDLPSVYQRDRGVAQARIAAAYLRGDAPDAAAVAATDALDIGQASGSARILTMLQMIAADLSRHENLPEVAAFRHALEEVTT